MPPRFLPCQCLITTADTPEGLRSFTDGPQDVRPNPRRGIARERGSGNGIIPTGSVGFQVACFSAGAAREPPLRPEFRYTSHVATPPGLGGNWRTGRHRRGWKPVPQRFGKRLLAGRRGQAAATAAAAQDEGHGNGQDDGHHGQDYGNKGHDFRR